jgi:formylglycine-generating enzyme required for sulfatase activity
MLRKGIFVGGFFLAFVAVAVFFYHWFHRDRDRKPDSRDRTSDAMILIPGGAFRMGCDGSPREAERPAHEVVIEEYLLDPHEVTNREFAEFIQATRYATTAEERGFSMVFDLKKKQWEKCPGACWRHPGGPETTLDGKDDLPVVHVSWRDAQAYCQWAKKRLPTEAEWEFAARGGLRDADYPWGREETPGGRYMANYRQLDKARDADGFETLAPVKSFPANRYKLYDMAGNVWEWCEDWFGEDYYAQSRRENPSGPKDGQKRVVRGGSWLCPENFFEGLTVFARSSRLPEDSSQNVGFRCAKRL